MRSPPWIAWAAAVAAALLAAVLAGVRVTDGDSCIYGAVAHEIARDGWRAWFAPHWAVGAEWACFHEHPPGAAWLAALAEICGVPPASAPVAAGALWQFAALAGVLALARRFLPARAAAIAGAVYLLHAPVLRDIGRFSLEAPVAACAAWTAACALRLGEGRRWIAATGLALAGAFLVRGVFGLVPLGVLVALCVFPGRRPPAARAAAAVALAALALLAFDRLHAAAAGHGFWVAYAERQVFPSLVAGGTAHSSDVRPWGYFAGRLVLLSLPWSLLPVVRLVRGPRPVAEPAAWRIAAVWIALTLAGALATTRPASRYLFEAVPALALLAALAAGPDPPRWAVRAAAVVLLAAIPAGLVVKSRIAARDARWHAAAALAEFRAAGGEPAPVVVDFPPEADSLSSFLRFHLGVPVLGPGAHGAASLRIWVRGDGPVPAGSRALSSTGLGTLCGRR